MQWLIIARDGSDPEAPARRRAARPHHLENAAKLQAEGHLLIGGALLDDRGEMIGSACVATFETRAELDRWLATDPYVTGGVWLDIQVMPYRVAPHYDCAPSDDQDRAASPCPSATSVVSRLFRSETGRWRRITDSISDAQA